MGPCWFVKPDTIINEMVYDEENMSQYNVSVQMIGYNRTGDQVSGMLDFFRNPIYGPAIMAKNTCSWPSTLLCRL